MFEKVHLFHSQTFELQVLIVKIGKNKIFRSNFYIIGKAIFVGKTWKNLLLPLEVQVKYFHVEIGINKNIFYYPAGKAHKQICMFATRNTI